MVPRRSSTDRLFLQLHVKLAIFLGVTQAVDSFSVMAKGGKPEIKSKCTTKDKASKQMRKLGMVSRLKKGFY